MPNGTKITEKPGELVERVPREIKEMEPKPAISLVVVNSAFFNKIARETGIGVSGPFAKSLVRAVSEMEPDRQKRVLDILKDRERGDNCAIATLEAVSKLASGGELHGVETVSARGRTVDLTKLGSVLGQLNRKQVGAILEAIEANPSEEVVGLADRIRTSIEEAQK